MTYSHFFDRVRTGAAPPRGSETVWGVTMTPVNVPAIMAPVASDSDGICASQIPSGAGAMTMNGALVTTVDGLPVAILDYARAVSVESDNIADTTQVITITGYDHYNQLMVENITLGAATINGKKAFKKVTGVSISAATIGNVIVGTTIIFGVPYRVNGRYALQVFFDTAFTTDGTFVAAVTSTATATTGDVRGTYTPATSPDGSKKLVFYALIEDPDTAAGFYGVDQYAG